jgi:hypothetical protein
MIFNEMTTEQVAQTMLKTVEQMSEAEKAKLREIFKMDAVRRAFARRRPTNKIQ